MAKTGPSRLLSIPGFNNLFYGRDLNEVFKPGIIYDIRDIAGSIIITPIGESVIDSDRAKYLKFSSIMMDGKNLMTKEEYKIQMEENIKNKTNEL